MKKVSVQFNMEVDDDVTHREITEAVKNKNLQNDSGFGKITSVEINNISASRRK